MNDYDNDKMPIEQVGPAGKAYGASYKQPTIKEMLEKASYAAIEENKLRERAYQILTAHPEFEEFLTLRGILSRLGLPN